MSTAFDVVFAVFVAAMATLAVVAVRWARGRDRLARARQVPTSDQVGAAGTAVVPPGAARDGRAP